MVEHLRQGSEILSHRQQQTCQRGPHPEEANPIPTSHRLPSPAQGQGQGQDSEVDLRLVVVPGDSPVGQGVESVCKSERNRALRPLPVKERDQDCQQRGGMDRVQRKEFIAPSFPDRTLRVFRCRQELDGCPQSAEGIEGRDLPEKFSSERAAKECVRSDQACTVEQGLRMSSKDLPSHQQRPEDDISPTTLLGESLDHQQDPRHQCHCMQKARVEHPRHCKATQGVDDRRKKRRTTREADRAAISIRRQ